MGAEFVIRISSIAMKFFRGPGWDQEMEDTDFLDAALILTRISSAERIGGRRPGVCVTLDVTPGASLPIPCRHCGKIIYWKMAPGASTLTCKKCDRITEIASYLETGVWRIRTWDRAAEILSKKE